MRTMNRSHALINGFDQLKRQELHTAEYYLGASGMAAENGNLDLARLYRNLRESHGDLALAFENMRHDLEKSDPDGMWGETLHAFIDAFKAFIADMPVLFIESETHPTPETFIEFETGLLERYRLLCENADERGKDLLERAIVAGDRHLRQLQQYDKSR
jgi:hypothetical protein